MTLPAIAIEFHHQEHLTYLVDLSCQGAVHEGQFTLPYDPPTWTAILRALEPGFDGFVKNRTANGEPFTDFVAASDFERFAQLRQWNSFSQQDDATAFRIMFRDDIIQVTPFGVARW